MKTYDEYKMALWMRESNNNPKAVNTYGYLGLLQLGTDALITMGLKCHHCKSWILGWNTKKFLEDRAFQEELTDKWLRFVKKKCLQWDFSEFYGDRIDLSGTMAGCHLMWYGGLKDYFKKGIDRKDGYGTPISEYIIKFSGYDVGDL